MAHSMTNASKGQFMARAAGYSTRGARNGVNLLGWESDEDLSVEDQIACLRLRAGQLNSELAAIDRSDPKRSDIVREFHVINESLRELKGYSKSQKKKLSRGVESFFMDVAKESLTKPEFDRWLRIARQRKDQDK